ncbi:V-type ATPase [Neocallimastix californiae]|uniref:V-type proton ATPase proteolipid subunit n=1 Tax=Neocallimastix californiae TaxID=1754190 RepID=A0A1Y2CP57_9FUNG|nr:V-type ATPase [Neocallimastix californiae]|eukprot:ORY48811.1 V-type ATPase [Neocallimastix californiae]
MATQVSNAVYNSSFCPDYASFFGFAGAGLATIFSSIGSAYGTAKAGMGIAGMGTFRPELIMKSLIPVVMAGIVAVYGLVVSVLIAGQLEDKPYSLFSGFVHFFSGITTGLTGVASGLCYWYCWLYVSMVLILIFAEVLGLYGLIVSLIMNTKANNTTCI